MVQIYCTELCRHTRSNQLHVVWTMAPSLCEPAAGFRKCPTHCFLHPRPLHPTGLSPAQILSLSMHSSGVMMSYTCKACSSMQDRDCTFVLRKLCGRSHAVLPCWSGRDSVSMPHLIYSRLNSPGRATTSQACLQQAWPPQELTALAPPPPV